METVENAQGEATMYQGDPAAEGIAAAKMDDYYRSREAMPIRVRVNTTGGEVTSCRYLYRWEVSTRGASLASGYSHRPDRAEAAALDWLANNVDAREVGDFEIVSGIGDLLVALG